MANLKQWQTALKTADEYMENFPNPDFYRGQARNPPIAEFDEVMDGIAQIGWRSNSQESMSLTASAWTVYAIDKDGEIIHSYETRG
jgi:hypothetical protein